MTQTGPTRQWEQLVAAAVLGTDRVGERLPIPEGAPARLAALELDPAARLLRSAAVLSVYERAGRRPGDSRTEQIRARDNDVNPECSFRAGQQLAQILAGEHRPLLDEWCELAARRGVRAPAHLLPPLLDEFANRRGETAAALADVLGDRGRWLASLNAEWKLFRIDGVDDSAAVWRSGERVERLALLRSLRSSDARAARDLMMTTWEQDSGDDRAAFVQAIAIGLSAADEAFLESALDDARKPVRQTAAELLARLPSSAFCGRMAARATSLITLDSPKRLRRLVQLHVSLPEKPDKAALRDGLEYRRLGEMGERAHLLSQIVAATPLAIWEASKFPPAEIIEAAAADDWREPLLRGWTSAAARFGSVDWAEPLLRIHLDANDKHDGEAARSLVEALAPGERERILTPLLDARGPKLAVRLSLLEFCKHPWSESFSRAALRAMKRCFGAVGYDLSHGLHSSIKQHAARHLAPCVVDEIDSGWKRDSELWAKFDEDMVCALATTLAFRGAMQEELRV